jgi:hypothetical protein
MSFTTTLLFLVTSTILAGFVVVLIDDHFRRTPDQLVTSTSDTFTPDEASDLMDALNAHYMFLTHHQGFEDHQFDTGVERPSLTNPVLSGAQYRNDAGAATLVDVYDVLDVVNAPNYDYEASLSAWTAWRDLSDRLATDLAIETASRRIAHQYAR